MMDCAGAGATNCGRYPGSGLEDHPDLVHLHRRHRKRPIAMNFDGVAFLQDGKRALVRCLNSSCLPFLRIRRNGLSRSARGVLGSSTVPLAGLVTAMRLTSAP